MIGFCQGKTHFPLHPKEAFPEALSYSYDGDDRLLSTETYDANGNTTITGSRTFAYDFENRLKSMNGGAVTIVYDGDGNRVAKTVAGTTTRYLVDDLNQTGYAQVVEELVGGVVQRTYTYGIQRINQNQLISGAWAPSFYGYDGLGSVRQLTNTTGAVTDTYDYDAWGNAVNATGTTPNSYLYRGEQFDPDLGLYSFRARYFNPLSGRFLTRDAVAVRSGRFRDSHRYLYAGSDPIDFRDPSGRNFVEDALLKASTVIRSAVQMAYANAHIVGYVACIAAFTYVNYEILQQTVPSDIFPPPEPPQEWAGPNPRGILIAWGALQIAQSFCGWYLPE